MALVEAPPWFHFNHSKNCGLPDYYIEPANIQSETGWNWYCWGNLWVLFSRQNWLRLNVFQAFFWPRKYGFTLKFSRHFMNLPESQKKSASCLRPAKWSSECLWLLLIFEMIFSIIVILNVNHSGNLSLYDGYHIIFKRSSLQQDLNDIYCHHYCCHNGPLDIQNHHDHHYHKSWRWSSYLHLCSWFSTSWYTFQANHAILLDMVMMMIMIKV